MGVIALLAGLFFIVLVAAVWGIFKPYSLGKFEPSRAQFALASVAAFVVIGVAAPDPGSDASVDQVAVLGSDADAAETTADPASTEPSDKFADYRASLLREIESMEDNNTLEEVPTERNGITIAVAVMGARAQIYADRPTHDDAELKKLEDQFIRLSKNYQRDAFPKLRKALADGMDDIMWEHNVDVSTFGSRNRRLKLTGGIFASNKGIKAAQEGLQDTPVLLRFDETRYEWYKGSDYQYFTYDSALKDDDWAVITGSGWKKLD